MTKLRRSLIWNSLLAPVNTAKNSSGLLGQLKPIALARIRNKQENLESEFEKAESNHLMTASVLDAQAHSLQGEAIKPTAHLTVASG